MKRYFKALYYRLMEDDEGESLKYLTVIVLIIATIISGIIFYQGYREANRAKGRLATVEEVALMKYHGVHFMEFEKGIPYFYRDGRKIYASQPLAASH